MRNLGKAVQAIGLIIIILAFMLLKYCMSSMLLLLIDALIFVAGGICMTHKEE